MTLMHSRPYEGALGQQSAVASAHLRDTMVACRAIEHSDLPAVADLLACGFPKRTRQYWMTGLEKLAMHKVPNGYQQFGYILVSGTLVVGVILMISSHRSGFPQASLRCNVSSWYVQPKYRAYASLLSGRANATGATLLNVSPASYTIPIIEAQGFRKFSSGMFAALPSWRQPQTRAELCFSPAQWQRSETISQDHLRLLTDHRAFGCVSLWLDTPEGGFPFVFRRRWIRAALAIVPAAQLIYAPSLDAIEKYHGHLGRYFLARGVPVTLICTDRPLNNIAGYHFRQRTPMYCRGLDDPSPTDLCYTEAAIFGL
jgi:hypothetical protein